MARKKITHLYSKKIPKNRISESADISDVKHDLENQIIKIHQELENLRLKVHLPDKSLTDVYRELCGTHPYEISKSLTFIDRLVYQMFCEMACITILD